MCEWKTWKIQQKTEMWLKKIWCPKPWVNNSETSMLVSLLESELRKCELPCPSPCQYIKYLILIDLVKKENLKNEIIDPIIQLYQMRYK